MDGKITIRINIHEKYTEQNIQNYQHNKPKGNSKDGINIQKHQQNKTYRKSMDGTKHPKISTE